MQGHDRRRESRVEQNLAEVWEQVEVGGVDGVELALRLRQVGACPQAPHLLPAVAVPLVVGTRRRRERDRPDDLDLGIDEAELRRQDPDHRHLAAVDAEGLAEHRGGAAQRPLPAS